MNSSTVLTYHYVDRIFINIFAQFKVILLRYLYHVVNLAETIHHVIIQTHHGKFLIIV
jgi:hypothetical protein